MPRPLAVFATKLAGAGLALLLNVTVSRTIGIHEAGMFFIGLSLVTMLYALARFGMGYAIYRCVAELSETGRQDALADTVRAALGRVGLLSLPAGTLMALASPWLAGLLFGDAGKAPVLAVLAATIPVYCLGSVLSEVLRGRRQPLQYALFENVLIKALAIPLVIGLGTAFGLVGAGLGFLAANAGALVFAAIAVVRVLKPIAGVPAPCDRPALYRAARYFAVVSIAGVTTQWLGPLVVGSLLSPADAALFFTAYRTAAVLDFVVISIVAVAGPAFVGAFARSGASGVGAMARPAALRALAGALALAMPLWLSARFIMGLYGEAFAAGETVLRILIAFQVLNAPLGVFTAAAIARKQERRMAGAALVAVSASALLIAAGTGLYGLTGAACASGLALVLQNGLVLLFLKIPMAEKRWVPQRS